jgi:uncharacterized protein YodC (DUF2158 family)
MVSKNMNSDVRRIMMVFKPGDVVLLKSGGPRMTVEEIFEIDGGEQVSCVWIEKVGNKQVVKREAFLSAVLKHDSNTGASVNFRPARF